MKPREAYENLLKHMVIKDTKNAIVVANSIYALWKHFDKLDKEEKK
jgi:hypothetical protein